ncbi:MAG: hypothetical protein JJ974_00760 [Phycisphaerales bacterium]|nr:hypothetical protein [Phycisphaerales bacterium]
MKASKRSLLTAFAASALASTAGAATITVGPSLTDFDYITITAAISAAVDGDVIEIAPGLYPENLSISSKDLTLRNAGGGTVTVFGQDLGKCLVITGGSTDAFVEGITFTRGFSTTAGAGVSIEGGARADITDCIIENSMNTGVGGGLYMSGGGTITRTIIRDNQAVGNGGGIYLIGSLQKNFIDCTIENNTGVEGGGLAYDASGDIIDIIGCTFKDNTATNRGGAITVLGGSSSAGVVEAENCRFLSNRADTAGGAVWVSDRDIFRAFNTIFIENSAGDDGGAIRNEQIVDLINCTMVNNEVDTEGRGDTFSTIRSDANTILLNCIVVNESADSHFSIGDYLPTYSLLPEAPSGTPDSNGNFNADPMFTDALMNDYTLAAGSPAIDAGNSRGGHGGINVLDIMTDLNDDVRNLDDQDTPNTGISTWELCVDLGAYEYQPSNAPACQADLNDDGILDFFDISAFLTIFSSGCP